ncbi:sulfurtransferase [Nonomuraea sp. WAC 01424]|uniref:rhodanese-like domain-containing protein n=1 Tax=Nonomuraea sp. WAC 01424 TaxID=2203200 RepID=UPI000F7B49E0|nr:rhodanese-like domain-containing protein [Nonomuraea sp. WAC 01424]RSN11433.1 sulfurtransferase [Nonomuraea sp. WAC 01424]
MRRLLEAGDPPRLIDVRTPGEFDAAHIPGSRNVPLDLRRAHGDVLRAHLDERAVLVCHSGRRAGQAGRVLADAGLPGLRVLAGGISAWQDAGAPLTTGKPRWALERQVRLVAGSIMLGSVLTSARLPRAKWVAAGIGAGLTYAALSNTCAMGMLLSRLPCNRGPRTDLTTALDALATGGR